MRKGRERMINKKYLLKVTLFWSVILLVIPMNIYAQSPDDELDEAIEVAPSGRLNLTFEQLGNTTQELNQNRPSRTIRVNLPGNFQIVPGNSSINLITSHLPETPEKPSVVQVTVNNNLASSFALTQTNAISSNRLIELPENVLKNGQNSILLNLDTGATCAEPGAFLKTFVDSNSTISFNYQQNPYPVDLGLYPFPFTERSLLNIPVTIVLPDQPTSNDISAASVIAAGLGQASNGNINLSMLVASEVTPEIQNNSHLIVVGQYEANDLIQELELPLPINDTTLKPAYGVLQEIISPWNEFRLVLVVTSLDEEGLIKASQALNRQANFFGMRGPVAVVVELGSVPDTTAVPQTSSFTLASLGYEDKISYGVLPQTIPFDFTLPLGWQLQDEPFAVIKFSHADIISPESVMDIKLNNTPIGSVILDESNIREGELNLSLPTRLLEAGRNRLDVTIEMKLADEEDDPCQNIGNERAWTVISSESEIFLPYQAVNLEPDLSRFPFPFAQNIDAAPTLFVLPDQPTSQLLNDLAQLSVMIGSASQIEQISVQTLYASEVDQTLHQDHHLILLGRPTQNLLLAEINENLPQPFVDNSDMLKPLVIDNVAFLPDPARDAGLLEIVASPWNEDLNLLAVTGTTDTGVSLATQALLNYTRRLNGDLAVVEPNLDPFAADTDEITIYSVNTQTANLSELGAVEEPLQNSLSQDVVSTLAERWWR